MLSCAHAALLKKYNVNFTVDMILPSLCSQTVLDKGYKTYWTVTQIVLYYSNHLDEMTEMVITPKGYYFTLLNGCVQCKL